MNNGIPQQEESLDWLVCYERDNEIFEFQVLLAELIKSK